MLETGKAFDNVLWFGLDVGRVAGTAAVAFTLQPVIAAIIKTNKKQENNLRDLKVGFIIGLFVYCCIGFMGSLAIWDIVCDETIINCFLKDFSSVLVEATYLYGLMTVLPCFLTIGRSKILLHFFPEITPGIFRNFNLMFITFSLSVCFLSPYIKVDSLISLIGSITSYYMIYYIPAILHLKCLHGSEEKLLGQTPDSLVASEVSQDELNDKNWEVRCAHSPDYKDRHSKRFRNVGCFLFNILGVIIGVYGIYQVFDAIFSWDSFSYLMSKGGLKFLLSWYCLYLSEI